MYANFSKESKNIQFLISYVSDNSIGRQIISEDDLEVLRSYCREQDNVLNVEGIKAVEAFISEKFNINDPIVIAVSNLGLGFKDDFQLQI